MPHVPRQRLYHRVKNTSRHERIRCYRAVVHAKYRYIRNAQPFICVEVFQRPLPRPRQWLGGDHRRNGAARVGVVTKLPRAIDYANNVSSRVRMADMPQLALAYAHHKNQSDTIPVDPVQNGPSRLFSD